LHGVLLAERMDHEARIFLYQIDSFYLELFHEIYEVKDNFIRILRCFKDTSLLDNYLINFDISTLQLF
jgi:hypothetical protein